MLWYKAWLETRARFFTGLVILLVLAAGTVFGYPRLRELLPLTSSVRPSSGLVGRAFQEAIELSRSFAGHVYQQWFSQNLPQMAVLFAIIIGGGSAFSQSRGALFTLSIPASRGEVLGTRALIGLAQVAVLAFVPSLLIPLFAPAIGESQNVLDVLIHGLSVFLGGAVFFSLATLFTALFMDVWRPILFACLIFFILTFCEAIFPDLPYGAMHMMRGTVHFRAADLPWISWLVSAAGSAALLFLAIRSIERRDF